MKEKNGKPRSYITTTTKAVIRKSFQTRNSMQLQHWLLQPQATQRFQGWLFNYNTLRWDICYDQYHQLCSEYLNYSRLKHSKLPMQGLRGNHHLNHHQKNLLRPHNIQQTMIRMMREIVMILIVMVMEVNNNPFLSEKLLYVQSRDCAS